MLSLRLFDDVRYTDVNLSSGALYSLLLFFLLIGQVGGWGIGISLVGPIAVRSHRKCIDQC